MPFMPFQILGLWLRALLSVALLGVGIYLIKEWADRRFEPAVSTIPDATAALDAATFPETANDSERIDGGLRPLDSVPTAHGNGTRVRRSDSHLGFNPATGFLVGGLTLILWSLAGGWITSGIFFRPHDSDPPKANSGGTIERLQRPDGTELHVECFGSPELIPLILTHGWGLDSNEWTYARKELASRCRIIVWDLPGLGRSKGPANKDWSLEKLARDLDAVLTFAGNRPAILAGHSIGGMIILTYCRLFPQTLAQRVSGLVLAQTTYTNPIETTSMAPLYRPLQKPLLEPLCHLMVWLAPLVWLMNWYSYLNGSVHRSNHRSFFSGSETREQLGFIARYSVEAWPGVIARGLLAMFQYDATATLTTISVPTLVVDGDRDTTCQPGASVKMSQTIPKAHLTTLKSARHGGIFEFHQQFANAIHQLISTELPEPKQPMPAGQRTTEPAVSSLRS